MGTIGGVGPRAVLATTSGLGADFVWGLARAGVPKPRRSSRSGSLASHSDRLFGFPFFPFSSFPCFFFLGLPIPAVRRNSQCSTLKLSSNPSCSVSEWCFGWDSHHRLHCALGFCSSPCFAGLIGARPGIGDRGHLLWRAQCDLCPCPAWSRTAEYGSGSCLAPCRVKGCFVRLRW